MQVTENDEGVVSYGPFDYELDSLRFSISLTVPDKSKPYFFPTPLWNRLAEQSNDRNTFIVDHLSGEKHGCITNGFPYTHSVTYRSPFFLVSKLNQSLTNNYVRFTDFYNNPTYMNILAALTFDDINNTFLASYNPRSLIPYSNSLNLSSVLEFYLVDSDGVMLDVKDNSQIFISLKVY